jgi:hypothetical protein
VLGRAVVRLNALQAELRMPVHNSSEVDCCRNTRDTAAVLSDIDLDQDAESCAVTFCDSRQLVRIICAVN